MRLEAVGAVKGGRGRRRLRRSDAVIRRPRRASPSHRSFPSTRPRPMLPAALPWTAICDVPSIDLDLRADGYSTQPFTIRRD